MDICQHNRHYTHTDAGCGTNPFIQTSAEVVDMATEPQNRKPIREERKRRVPDGGELNEETMAVQRSGNSLVVGLTAHGVKTHDLDTDCEVTVKTYLDGIWIQVEGDSDESE